MIISIEKTERNTKTGEWLVPLGSKHVGFSANDNNKMLCEIDEGSELPDGAEVYNQPLGELTVSVKEFLNLIGFEAIKKIFEVMDNAEHPLKSSMEAAQSLMDVRDDVTLNSDKMGKYYALLVGAGVVTTDDIARVKQGKAVIAKL